MSEHFPSQYIPFDRYESSLFWLKNAATEYKYGNRYNLNPEDFNTTEKEIEWYLDAIENARKKNSQYIKDVKRKLSIVCAVVITIFSFFLEKVLSSDPLWYVGAVVASVLFSVIAIFAVWNLNSLDSWLRYIYRNMCFPPIQPNIESFLSAYQSQVLEENRKRYR